MADLSDAFIGLPGGYGTLEVRPSAPYATPARNVSLTVRALQEVAEMTTWSQIGVHLKPVVLLNVNHFYSSLRDFFQK